MTPQRLEFPRAPPKAASGSCGRGGSTMGAGYWGRRQSLPGPRAHMAVGAALWQCVAAEDCTV